MDIVSKSEETLPIKIFLFKVSNRNTKKLGELCSELTKKTAEWWRRSALGEIEIHNMGSEQTFTFSKTTIEKCVKLTIEKSERVQWRRSGNFIVKFEYISHLVLVFLLWTLSMYLFALCDRFYISIVLDLMVPSCILF